MKRQHPTAARRGLSRRQFLRGAAGFALAIPSLPSLLTRAQAQGERSLRFVCVASQFGRDQTHWVADHPNLTPSGDGRYQYGTLSAFRGDISRIFGPVYDQGLRRKLAIASGLDLMGWTNGHTETIVLTGGSSGSKDPNAFGESLDCVLEASGKFYPELPMLGALRAGPTRGNRLSVTSRFAHCQTLPALKKATDIYNQLFDPAGVAAGAQRNADLARVTHLAFEDYKRTSTSLRISASDKARLDNYMDIVSDIENKIGRVPSITCDRLPDGFSPEHPGTAEALHDLFFDLEVAALTCGITKIATHGIYHVESNPNQLLGPDYHGSAHNHGNVVTGGRTFVDYNRWTMDRVGSLLKKLDAVDDGDGNSLLDNTVFYFSSSDASGSHSHYDMPVLLAGAKGLIRTDTYIDFRHATVRRANGNQVTVGVPYNNLLVSLFNVFGLDATDYTLFDGQVGFGEYSDGLRNFEDHYRPMVAASERNKKLPYLFL